MINAYNKRALVLYDITLVECVVCYVGYFGDLFWN